MRLLDIMRNMILDFTSFRIAIKQKQACLRKLYKKLLPLYIYAGRNFLYLTKKLDLKRLVLE